MITLSYFGTTSSRWVKWQFFSKIFSQNTNDWRDWNQAADMLRVLLSFSVDVSAIEETYFVVTTILGCFQGIWLICKAYGYKQAIYVYLLVKPTLGFSVHFVHTDALDRLNITSIDVKRFFICDHYSAWVQQMKGFSFFLLDGHAWWIRLI